MALDKEFILDITDLANKLDIDPSFVEKDWYATQAMEAIKACSTDEVSPLFCGGTSLSKAYDLIKRFSEDLDYRGISDDGLAPSKGAKKSLPKISGGSVK